MHMKARQGAVILGAAVLALSGLTAVASAAQAPSVTCDGELSSGTYQNVTVTGTCTVPDGAQVTVQHNISVESGAMFDASTHSTLTVGRNVSGAPGSTVALGCTFAHPCDDGVPGDVGADTVMGNVTLDHVYNAAINGVTIGGNLTSDGGGAGPLFPVPFIAFSVKDDTIHGNVAVNGLNTSWFGVIRSQIDGNVVLTDVQTADPDGNEVVANTIGRNLICHGNTPASQFGDAIEEAPFPGYGPNTVGGNALGQCASLTELPAG